MKKSVLVVGSGGREHAIAWKLNHSPRLGKLYIAPGNAGTALVGENVPIQAVNIDGLLEFALAKKIDLTVVGPDDPLALGIVDAFQSKGLRIFGPTKGAAQIESSKVFSKSLMMQAQVPTAPYGVFYTYDDALMMAMNHFTVSKERIVIKANGLALGKGVYVCWTLFEADHALSEIMKKRVHGNAGDSVIIENFIEGPEVSIHAISDGSTFQLFPPAQDHKPLLDGDKGPNTGSMGTIAPVPWFKHMHLVMQKIVKPTLAEMVAQGHPFAGLLYPGIKAANSGPVVLEFNARFGDPETQVFIRLLKTDLLDIFEACVDKRLKDIVIEWFPRYAACVVMASEGYPSVDYRKGALITGIDDAESLPSSVVVFQAGTKMVGNNLVTSGGRVLGVTAIAKTLKEAIAGAYEGVEHIHFEGKQYRKDIGATSLERN